MLVAGGFRKVCAPITSVLSNSVRFNSKGPKWPPDPFPQPPPASEYQHLNQKQRKDQGFPCHFWDPELMNDAWKAKQLMRKYNDCDVDDDYMRAKILKTMLHPECSEKIYIEPPMIIDYGYNIKAGDNLFVNFNSILLDTAPITLGCNVFIAPRVSIFTATHPICPKQRLEYDLAKPITIGDNVWLGGGVIVCPGVKIGDGVIAAAGAVITKDVPSFCIVGGNPAKIIRYLPGAKEPKSK